VNELWLSSNLRLMGKGEMGMQLRYGAVITAAILSLVGAQPGMAQQAAPSPAAPSAAASSVGPYGPNSRGGVTATPIKHVIIIIGENRTFDHIFATYNSPLIKSRTSRLGTLCWVRFQSHPNMLRCANREETLSTG